MKKYKITRMNDVFEGTIVCKNGIYELVQFDIEDLDDLLESFVWIIREYFPEYEFNENLYIYGLAVGGRLIVKGPGYMGKVTTFDDLRSRIEHCENEYRLSVADNWESPLCEKIYKKQHSTVLERMSAIKHSLDDLNRRNCEVSAMISDDEREIYYYDISYKGIKLRHLIKCFSTETAHMCSDVDVLCSSLIKGTKVLFGVKTIEGEVDMGLFTSIEDIFYEFETDKDGSSYIFRNEDEYFCGDYEVAMICDIADFADSFVKILDKDVEVLSSYDPEVYKKEREQRLAAIKNSKSESLFDWESVDSTDMDWGVCVYPLFGKEVYADLFYRWLYALDVKDE